ncbi:MAG: ATP-binding protein [Gammaproteobacteria bacterium]|nr:ATP-binding protein [Gammaproteobacteria bacterium]
MTEPKITHKKLSEREHIIKRPAMYIGAVDLTKVDEFFLDGDKMVYSTVEYVPGLIKIINEIIDNSVDEAIKNNFKFSNEISVNITDTDVTVKDNGTGIPVVKNADGHYIPELCWNHARAGSNFDDDDNRTQIGMNGVGSFATACFSKEFIGKTDDGKNSYTIKIKNNAESFKESVGATKAQGTAVQFYPDLEKFGLTVIDETHKNVIRQRLINLSMTFPDINFKFNGKKINVSTFKKYVSLFNESFELYESDDYRFAVIPNSDDDFKQFSYVNGLKIPDGGTHIDVITSNLVNRIRDKLVRKYKTIKPGDIRNKLMVIAFLKNVKNPKFNSQAKEKITNSVAEINAYFGDIPYDSITAKVLKNSDIMDPIVEVYKIKEELKRRQDMKELGKAPKKIKSDKYLPPIESKNYLLLTEGASATGGLMPAIGRKNCGYYELKGKPLNAYSADQKKFTSNKELSELYMILNNEDYDQIIFATDQDLDGFHIRGLLVGFFTKYLPDFKGKIGILNTPVIGIKKAGKLVRWNYSLQDEVKLAAGETSKYYKGLGSWKESDLKHIIQTDGLNKMIDIIDFDDETVIDEWLSDATVEQRKEYIMNNEFNIASA